MSCETLHSEITHITPLFQNNYFDLTDYAVDKIYTTGDGRIDINIEEESNRTIFKIKDEGVGINAVDIPKLFDKFAKINTKPTGQKSSTGLGLYIASLLAKQIDGKITVLSEKGVGSAFSLILPKSL